MQRPRSPQSLILAALLAVWIPASLPDLHGSPSSPSPRLSADSLHSLLDQALQAFSSQDFIAAASLFSRLQQEFGAEPEYLDPQFQRRLLPIRGYAELAAGQPHAAADTLTRFVAAHPRDPQHPAALQSLASALHHAGRLQEAHDRLADFKRHYANRPETWLTELQRAGLLSELGKSAEAAALLADLLASDAPQLLREQARLQAGRRALDRGDLAPAVELLLDHPWEIGSLAEIITLSMAALDLGDRLLEAEIPADALRAYQLVLPRPRLIHLQQSRNEELERLLQNPPAAQANLFWSGFHRRLLQKTNTQLRGLESADDYTPSLLLRRGQAFLFADRFREAWLLFERLALDESLDPAFREEAHYRWILAANGLESWEESLAIARNFLSRYPSAELAPHALYLIAQAHEEQRRYHESAEILAGLLADFPGHPLAQRWRFNLGFNHALLEDFPEARIHFAQAAADHEATQLTANAELWHGLTFFFARDYPTALQEFDALANRYARHPLSGEIQYRRAATLYAMRDYPRAASAASEFIERFPYHPRHDEALVLLGDIQMGAGALDDALRTFAKIQPEAGHGFVYALFQQGKIFRAQEKYEEMVALFSAYSRRDDIVEKPRLSEALYWIGWAYNALDRPAEALPLFHDALAAHGNDPDAGEIASILSLLERLEPPADGIDNNGFSSWIADERPRALSEGRLTYFSRLTLHLARQKRRSGAAVHADNHLFEIADLVPLDLLGPDALGEVGHMLTTLDLQSADEFFKSLLTRFPNAPERAFAFHGLGKQAQRSGDHEQALLWLRRFTHETPTHPLIGDALQLAGESLAALGRYSEADEQFEEILSLRSMRGRPHANALLGLARNAAAAGDPARAIAYYQRVYTVHRAQPDLTAEAYYQSSLLFEQLNDPGAAHRSLAEMLSLAELATSPFFEKARRREPLLAAHIDDSLTPERIPE